MGKNDEKKKGEVKGTFDKVVDVAVNVGKVAVAGTAVLAFIGAAMLFSEKHGSKDTENNGGVSFE